MKFIKARGGKYFNVNHIKALRIGTAKSLSDREVSFTIDLEFDDGDDEIYPFVSFEKYEEAEKFLEELIDELEED